MELVESHERLAEQNRSGVAFLTAYGVAGVRSRLATSARSRCRVRHALPGNRRLPRALGLSALLGAFDQERPVMEEITQLSVLVGTSQLLGLPFLAYLVVNLEHTLVPVAFAAITSMHFVLYSWLYQTPIYILMAVLISLGTPGAMMTAPQVDRQAGAARASVLTGGLLLATALALLVID